MIINVDFIDTLKRTNRNTIIKVIENSYQLTFCSVVLILPLIGNLLVHKFVKQYRLYASPCNALEFCKAFSSVLMVGSAALDI